MGTAAIGRRWGTWEELLLGGAVLRHGTGDWNLVAAEIRARIVFPYTCTPEVCKSKYEDLQQRFVGCKAWYEELRRQRIMELRQALEHSEDSIGSLESKLEALKSRKGDKSPFNSFSESESGGVVQKPKDELSAGSFTQDIITCSSPERQPAPLSAEEMKIEPEALQSLEQDKVSSIEKFGGMLYESQGGTVRKRRGKRKRKDCNRDVKEGSIGENNFSESANPATVSHSKENSCCNSFEARGSSDANDVNRSTGMDGVDTLMAIFKSIAENKSASIFRRRLDSQKRGRYKKIIRRHLDLDTIRSRVARRYIKSHKELYRDLLLLANNALIFYSRSTREHKSAGLLRDLITKTCKQLIKNSSSSMEGHTNHNQRTPICDLLVKPGRLRPGNDNLSRKEGNAGDVKTANGSRRRRNANFHRPLESSKKENAIGKSTTKKGHPGGSRKAVIGTSKRAAIPIKGRKRGRAK